MSKEVDAANKIDLDEMHQLAFEIGGDDEGGYQFTPEELEQFIIRLNSASDDSCRLDWLESRIHHYGDGYSDPREAYIDLNWDSWNRGSDFPGLRAAIDAEMQNSIIDLERSISPTETTAR